MLSRRPHEETEPLPMAQYHLSKNGRQAGPFSQEQLDQMLQAGFFAGTELVRQDDAPDWKPVSQLPGFVPAPPTVSSPPALPAQPSASAPARTNNCLILGLVGGGLLLIGIPVIALLAAIAVPNFLRARKRSQATRELMDLRLIDAAIDQYAIEHNKAPGIKVEWSDIRPFLPAGSKLSTSNGLDILGHPFGPKFTVDTLPVIPDATFQVLSDVAPAEFWSPYK